MGIFLDYTLHWTPGSWTFFANLPCLYPYYLIFLGLYFIIAVGFGLAFFFIGSNIYHGPSL